MASLVKEPWCAADHELDPAIGLVLAQELIEEIAARAFQPEVHECRARLAGMRGDSRAADSEIEEARRLYAAMGATTRVERLEIT